MRRDESDAAGVCERRLGGAWVPRAADSRVYAYDVVIVGDDPKARFFKSVYFEGCNVAPGHEPNNGITEVEIPAAELPAGRKLTVAVRPISSLGTKGKAIGTTCRV